MRALAPDPNNRYQRAADLLQDVLAAREPAPRKAERGGRSAPSGGGERVSEIQSRLKARETPQPSFCWHCRKPLHARSDRCPFCGESQ